MTSPHVLSNAFHIQHFISSLIDEDVWFTPTYSVVSVSLQLKDEEFDALEGFFCFLEKGIVDLHENVAAYLGHLQVSAASLSLSLVPFRKMPVVEPRV